MNIVLFSHPVFLHSTSMPRFAQMIVDGMRARGHHVTVWAPGPVFHRLPLQAKWRKWLGYLDQYVLFPLLVRWRLLFEPRNTLFVFADQALGPWVPLVAHRPHVVHVHDFMALRSALGEVPQNPTGRSGQQYQAMIRRGFSNGKNFVSVSENTKSELSRFLTCKPNRSTVVYNGLNFPFRPMGAHEALALLKQSGLELTAGEFLLHVGGNQWYKNRVGVLVIYAAYVHLTAEPLPLLMVGERPTPEMVEFAGQICQPGKVHFVSGLDNSAVCAAYSLAGVFIFPSLAEGFGWPIVEAMACGCPVLTTNAAPMTEVGGDVATYIPVMPAAAHEKSKWASGAAAAAKAVLGRSLAEKADAQAANLTHARNFDIAIAMNGYEQAYLAVLSDTTL